MKVSKKLLILLFVLGLIAAACGGDDSSDDGPSDPADLAVDVGVDIEAGTIKIGLLSDLTGAFGPLVSAIVAGQEVYWANVNANGGINGLQVELVVRDTVYEVPNHVQFYEELKDQVVAFGDISTLVVYVTASFQNSSLSFSFFVAVFME